MSGYRDWKDRVMSEQGLRLCRCEALLSLSRSKLDKDDKILYLEYDDPMDCVICGKKVDPSYCLELYNEFTHEVRFMHEECQGINASSFYDSDKAIIRILKYSGDEWIKVPMIDNCAKWYLAYK